MPSNGFNFFEEAIFESYPTKVNFLKSKVAFIEEYGTAGQVEPLQEEQVSYDPFEAKARELGQDKENLINALLLLYFSEQTQYTRLSENNVGYQAVEKLGKFLGGFGLIVSALWYGQVTYHKTSTILPQRIKPSINIVTSYSLAGVSATINAILSFFNNINMVEKQSLSFRENKAWSSIKLAGSLLLSAFASLPFYATGEDNELISDVGRGINSLATVNRILLTASSMDLLPRFGAEAIYNIFNPFLSFEKKERVIQWLFCHGQKRYHPLLNKTRAEQRLIFLDNRNKRTQWIACVREILMLIGAGAYSYFGSKDNTIAFNEIFKANIHGTNAAIFDIAWSIIEFFLNWRFMHYGAKSLQHGMFDSTYTAFVALTVLAYASGMSGLAQALVAESGLPAGFVGYLAAFVMNEGSNFKFFETTYGQRVRARCAQLISFIKSCGRRALPVSPGVSTPLLTEASVKGRQLKELLSTHHQQPSFNKLKLNSFWTALGGSLAVSSGLAGALFATSSGSSVNAFCLAEPTANMSLASSSCPERTEEALLTGAESLSFIIVSFAFLVMMGSLFYKCCIAPWSDSSSPGARYDFAFRDVIMTSSNEGSQLENEESALTPDVDVP